MTNETQLELVEVMNKSLNQIEEELTNKKNKLSCIRCGHKWYRRSPKLPKKCPNLTCQTRLYQKPDEKIEPPKKPLEKKTFSRDWSNYFRARQQERKIAIRLLSEALHILNIKQYANGRGRRPYPLKDKLFLCIQKVMRRTTYDAHEEFIEYSHLKKYITSKPRPHSVSDFMNDPQLTPILKRLITLTATPLDQVEKNFSTDSTGLSTPYKKRWVQVRMDKKEHKDYKKIHTLIGNKSKIIVAAKVTVGTSGDSPQLIPLLEIAKQYFNIKELSADGAYPSRENAQAVVDIGGKPYFKLRKNYTARSKGYPAWKAMILHFQKHKEDYLLHYHQRSLVETSYSMFKRKVNGSLMSKTSIAQTNEALCIAVIHNLFVLVNSIFCHNLEITFKK